MEIEARTPIDVILGEATYGTREQRFQDMVNIASVIANRVAKLRESPQDIVAVQAEFNGYGRTLPAGADAYRALAQEAWDYVQKNGPVHQGMFFATPKTTGRLPKGLKQVGSTSGHVFFSDPLNRTIRTARGYRQPYLATPESGPIPEARPGFGVDPMTTRSVDAPNYGPEISGTGISSAEPTPGSPADATRENLADVSYNMGRQRPNAPDQSIVDIARSSVRDVLGPGYSVDVISGQENPGRQYGSNRHKTGFAADIHVIDPTGRVLDAVNNRQQLLDVAQAAAAKGAKGIGLGSNYMAANGMHIDKVQAGPGQSNQWGNLAGTNAALLDGARNYAEMPASFYAKALPSRMDVPPSRPSSLPSVPTSPDQRSWLPSGEEVPAPPGAASFLTVPALTAPSQFIVPQGQLPTFVPASPDGPAQAPAKPVQQRIDEAFALAAAPRTTAAGIHDGRIGTAQASGANRAPPYLANHYGATAGRQGDRMAVVDNIEDFLGAAGPKQTSARNVPEADTTIRQAFEAGAIDDDSQKSGRYAAVESEIMGRAGSGLQQAVAIGANVLDPARAILPGAGMVAKVLADRARGKNSDELMRTMRSGAPANKVQTLNDSARRVAAALMAQAANAR